MHHAEGTRTSVMTHVAWAPPQWAAAARRTLAGLEELHPSRTILLFPRARKADAIDVDVELKCFTIPGSRARGLLGGDPAAARRRAHARPRLGRAAAADHRPADVLPLARPAAVGEPELEQLVGVFDRLVVDSSEWRGLPGAYAKLATLFDRIAVSDIAWGRSVGGAAGSRRSGRT